MAKKNKKNKAVSKMRDQGTIEAALAAALQDLDQKRQAHREDMTALRAAQKAVDDSSLRVEEALEYLGTLRDELDSLIAHVNGILDNAEADDYGEGQTYSEDDLFDE